MCASHAGEDIHIETVRSTLKKIGLDESYLRCGVHYPSNVATQLRMRREGVVATEVHCNCSGKHSGMLALCCKIKADLETYTDLEHPVQQLALQCISDFTELSISDIPLGIDGCGVPVHGLSIYHMALAWARLADPYGASEKHADAAKRVRTAMMNYPYLIAGEGRNCTLLMQALPGRIVAKSGADAVYCYALPEKGWGVALKIADGGSRAVGPALVSALRQLDHFSDQELEPLQRMEKVTLTNHRKDVVGEIKPVFRLQWA
jgi:L-asparaginase II